MAKNSGKKEQAKALYSQGTTVTTIAKKLKVDRRTVQRWKNDAQANGDDWDALRASLKPMQKPKIITFERPRQQHNQPSTPPSKASGPLDLVAVVEGAISNLAASLEEGYHQPGLGGIASGLVSLVRLRREMEDDEKLLEELMKRYKDPQQLVTALREAGWGRSA